MPNTRLDPEPQPLHGPGEIDLSRGHEHADIHLGGFIKFVAWLTVASIAIYVVCWFGLFGLDAMENAERLSGAVRPLPPRGDTPPIDMRRAINSNEGGAFSRRPTPIQPSPGHPRVDWKDMDLFREQQNRDLAELGLRPRPDQANLWVPRRMIPPLIVEAVADYLQQIRATTGPGTQPSGQPSARPSARQPEIGGGS